MGNMHWRYHSVFIFFVWKLLRWFKYFVQRYRRRLNAPLPPFPNREQYEEGERQILEHLDSDEHIYETMREHHEMVEYRA